MVENPIETAKEDGRAADASDPRLHFCQAPGCGRWGSFGQPGGTWYCLAHDPTGGRGSRGAPTVAYALSATKLF